MRIQRLAGNYCIRLLERQYYQLFLIVFKSLRKTAFLEGAYGVLFTLAWFVDKYRSGPNYLDFFFPRKKFLTY
jgi:hypothetical protein